jgi:glycerol-3-phosphate dehydrogenase (NAD(P)+)
MKIAVLGAGSWGTTLAHLLSRKHAVRLWARSIESVTEINQAKTLKRYLGDARLHSQLQAMTDIEQAASGADFVIMAIPSQSFDSVLSLAAPFIGKGTPIISVSKGLELSSLRRMTEIIRAQCPEMPAGVLTGPNLATEIMAGFAAASVLAFDDEALTAKWQDALHTPLFRIYRNTDVIGCEICGVLKNIIAIAAGMGDGLGAGDNTRSAMITRGLAEISRLGVALGAIPETFYGLAGMGDLVATCTSDKSRNRTVGFRLGQGESMEHILSSMFMVAEGVKSADAVLSLAASTRIDMPICTEVGRVIRGESDARRAFRELLKAEIGAEADPF